MRHPAFRRTAIAFAVCLALAAVWAAEDAKPSGVPEALAAKLRARAERNHRSLQGELMAILEAAAGEARAVRTGSPSNSYDIAVSAPDAGNLLDRLLAIAGDRGIDTTKKLTREQANDRGRLRKAGI